MKNILLGVTFAFQLFSQTSFKFAHLSDTHVGSATGADDLRHTVHDINQLTNLSFAIITGDVSEFGTDEQFRLAKQILDSLTVPWYIVPGNHDMKWSESGGTSFGKIFGSERFLFDFGQYTFVGVHQGPRMRMGDGYWTNEDVAWLDSVLSRLSGKKQRIIIATHYPADSGIANWYRVTTLAKKYGVQAFLNGHWHRNYYALFDGIPSVVGRSNLRARDSIGGYNIVEVVNDSMNYSIRIPGVETKQPWASVMLGNRNYSMAAIERKNYPETVKQEYSNVRYVWKTTSPSAMNCPPAVSRKYFVFAYHDGSVVIQHRISKRTFTIHTNSPIMATPAFDDRKIVIPSTDSNIYCYDINTQKMLWQVKTGAAVVAPPIISAGIVFCGASDRKFRAIDLKTGKLKWSFDSLQGHVETKPLIVKDKIIFGAWDEHLYCLDLKTGGLLWKWKGDRPGVLLSPAACEPVCAEGKVFIVAPDRCMTVIDLQTGRQIWRTNQFQVRETIGISDDGERVYVRTMNDSLYALSTRAIYPKVIWSLNAGFGYDINSAQIKEKDGVLFSATKNGLVIAVDGKTGTLLWKFKEDVVIAHTPIPLSRNSVIFSNVVGTVCEVEGLKR
jgi:outer membrane protein assembly factor BamB/predicted phosphohydrolase